jgi:hypothetical protein
MLHRRWPSLEACAPVEVERWNTTPEVQEVPFET